MRAGADCEDVKLIISSSNLTLAPPPFLYQRMRIEKHALLYCWSVARPSVLAKQFLSFLLYCQTIKKLNAYDTSLIFLSTL